MPVTKQAIKRMKQNRVRHARNKHYSSDMKSLIKLILGYVKKGEAENAKKILPKVSKAIDTAAKKNLIHKNNAAHKKSKVQKAVNTMGVAKAEKVEKKPAKAEKKEAKKEEKK